MALENTPLTNEIEEITKKGPMPVHYRWRAEILANGQHVEPLKVLSIDIVRDYAGAYADTILVEMAFGLGTFSHDIFPYNDLLVTLYREPLGEVSTDSDLTRDIESQSLRATLVDGSSPVIEGNAVVAGSKMAADISNIVYKQFQLVDLSLEQIRMLSVGTIFRNTSSADALKYFLTQVSQQVDVDDSHRIKGVDMVAPSSAAVQQHIVIPHGTRFTDIPELLHSDASGIYNAGFGYYLQNGYWYVYPLFDLTRYEKASKGLTLINVPKNRYPQIERTYRTTANQVIALVTGEVMHKDDTEALQLNQGNGVRFADAKLIMEGFTTTKDNKTTALRAKNNAEYLAEARDNGLNNVQLSSARITSNRFKELSKMARRAGSHLQAKWENSEPGLITPGMPVRYLYCVEDQLTEVHGTVIGAHHFTGTDTPGLTSARHITNTVLTLFLNRKIEWPTTT